MTLAGPYSPAGVHRVPQWYAWTIEMDVQVKRGFYDKESKGRMRPQWRGLELYTLRESFSVEVCIGSTPPFLLDPLSS
eukprot:scaffold898_cov168-Amphora_coffeaeformis.AAC.2